MCSLSVLLISILLISNTHAGAYGLQEQNESSELKNAASPTRSEIKATLNVVNHVFCQSCLRDRVQEDQNTLKEIHTYAELKHDPHVSLPSSFTICSTSMTPYVERWIPYQLFFTLAGKDGTPWFSAGVKHPNTFYMQSTNNYLRVETSPVFPHHWVRSCLALNTLSGLVQWVVDGTLVNNITLPEIKDDRNFPTDLTGKVILGASAGTSFPNWKAVSNMVTNLNIFSSALQVEIMQDYTKGGRCVAEGDYLAWREMQWNLYGEAVIQTVDEEEPCMEEPLVNLYNVGFPGMASCIHFCQNLGSRAPSVTSHQEWMTLQTFLKGALNRESTIGVAENIWVATDDQETEGDWQDFYTHEALNFTLPWMESEPNGEHRENCVYSRTYESFRWIDVGCHYSRGACTCKRNPVPQLNLRGLCPSSNIDINYQPMNSLTNFAKLTFVGLYDTLIEYEKDDKNWKLTVGASNVTGSSNARHATFMLGRHNWTITGDLGCTKSGEEYTKELKMSGCAKGKFTCDDGQCVRMDQRCNQLPECRDASDERNCNILILEEGYNMNVPPVRVIDGKKDVVIVSVSIDLLKIVDINEENYSIDFQFAITLEWIENRATFKNLKDDLSLNALIKKDIEQLWLPKVIYENTDQKASTRLGVQWEWDTSVVVKKKVNGTLTGLETIDETEFFQGAENSLVMMQTYTHEFQCSYDLKKYPFDTQVCSIDMVVRPLDRTFVSLSPKDLNVNQSLDMSIFQITNWNLGQETDVHGQMKLSMILVLKRKVMSELMTTYFPTVLLTAITFATTFFKPFFFEAALSVNLTTMLVMTTIFISKMEGLPPTSDVKMIDIWLILCQMVPFVEVVLLTAMEYYREEDNVQTPVVMFQKPLTNSEEEETFTETIKQKMRWLATALTNGGLRSLKTIGKFGFVNWVQNLSFSLQKRRCYLVWS